MSISETRSIYMVSKSVFLTSTSKFDFHSAAIWQSSLLSKNNVYTWYTWPAKHTILFPDNADMITEHQYQALHWIRHSFIKLAYILSFLARRLTWFYPVKVQTQKISTIRGKWPFINFQIFWLLWTVTETSRACSHEYEPSASLAYATAKKA